MTDRHTAINNSTSKQFYSFSKGTRFPSRSPINKHVAYDMKDGFGNNKALGTGRPFFSTSTRFDYYNSAKKQQRQPHPSPNLYKMKNTFGVESSKMNASYSFGMGRDDMKKIYVDHIKNEEVKMPGPGKYEATKHFGSKGLSYYMGARLPTDQ